MEQFWIMTGTIFHFLAGCGVTILGLSALVDGWNLRKPWWLAAAALLFYAAYLLFESV
jgi:hypothetical protein